MDTLKDNTQSIIEAYEDGLFNKMLEEYEELPNKYKRHFIRYCEEKELESVPLTILEYKTYRD